MLDILTITHFIVMGFAVIASFRFPLISPTLVLVLIGLGHYIGFLEPVGIAVLIAFYALAWYLPKTDQHRNIWVSRAAHTVFILFCIALAAHIFPGFNNFQFLDAVQKSSSSIPYDFYLNVDKWHVFFGVMLAVRTYELPYYINNRYTQYIIATVALMGLLQYLSIPLGLMKFDFGFPQWAPIWAFSNLLFTCAAEEAFFRHYLQRRLHKKFLPAKAIGIVAVLFGLAHFAGGPLFMVFAALAGVGYGTIYYLTGGRLLAAMFAHFTFNLSHLILFTYPLPL